MDGFWDQWSNAAQLWLRPEGPTVYTIPSPPLTAADAGKYTMELWYTTAPDYGMCELWQNGAKVAAWDGYDPDGIGRKKIEFPIELKEGENKLELHITGKNASSSGFMAGIDCYRVLPK